ncbi:hypothetical protein COOONC_11244 [Cooperia oncophora]
MPINGGKKNKIPAALQLDPDEVDKRDTDYNDYRVFQGRQFRVSAKDEAAFEQLRLLNLANSTRRTKRNRVMREQRSDDEENNYEETSEKQKKAERDRAVAAEKRKKAAEEKREATWIANGENMKSLVANNHTNGIRSFFFGSRAKRLVPVQAINVTPSFNSHPDQGRSLNRDPPRPERFVNGSDGIEIVYESGPSFTSKDSPISSPRLSQFTSSASSRSSKEPEVIILD